MKNLFWLLILFNSVCLAQTENDKITIDNIVLDSTLKFKIKNISKDTLYFLNDWSSFYREKSKSLHLKTYPKFGGMMPYNVTFIKLAPNEEFNTNILLYRLEENEIRKIVVVIGKVTSKKINSFKERQKTLFIVDSQEAISMIDAADKSIFTFNRVYVKQ